MAAEDIMVKEPMNIVVLGGSFAGLSVAHNFLRKTINDLGKTRTAPRYRVTLVSPSTHLFWNIGAPRALVAPDLLPPDKVFVDILEAFEEYPANRFQFVHGSAVAVDFGQRTVSVLPCPVMTAKEQTSKMMSSTRWSHQSKATAASASTRTSLQNIQVSYHALIVATGSSASSPLLSLHGPHENTISALQTFHGALVDAQSVLIAGGGPSGVECAGQLATYFNGKKSKNPGKEATDEKPKQSKTSTFCARLPNFMQPKPKQAAASKRQAKNITLVTGGERLLPRLPLDVSAKAEAQLRSLGVQITHNVRVTSAQEMPSGSTKCVLSNDMIMGVDLYIAATGVKPNTDFLPAELLDASGYVLSDPHYLRLERAGERVYAIGDCAAYSKNTILDVYDSIPIIMHNMRNDLWEFELKMQFPYGGAEEKIAALEDREFMQNPKIAQLVPITRFGGVGVLFDIKLPSFMVYLMKGRDYRAGKAKGVAGRGHDPYATPA